MKNTILFTPSNEQLIEIAQQNPELNSRIKQAIVLDLEKTATKFITSKLKAKSEQVFQAIYNSTEKKLFTMSDSWGKGAVGFSETIEKDLSAQIEKKLKEGLQKEFEDVFESSEFKNMLKAKIKEKMLIAVLKNLDSKIQDEAKKLIA